MQRSLRYDQDTRELRLVMTDDYDGMHERVEYRVALPDGPARGSQYEGYDGWTVGGGAGERWYMEPPRSYGDQRTWFDTEARPVVNERTACPRAANKRKRCATCAA